jgi:uncharacterized protein YdaU (DUF1376 family)
MHYFQFHIGDYRSSTAHLTNEEDLAYRRLLDMYYDLEGQIPLDTEWVSRRIRVEASIVRDVLNDMFERTEEGYRNERCDKEIAKYQALAERNRSNGSRGGRPKQNPVGSESQPTGKLTINQEPETNNHKPKVVRGTRLDPLFPFPPEWAEFCKEKRPDLVPREVFESFRDYWIAKAGQAGVKLDWDATWRNWVRSQKSTSFKQQTQLTVPSRPERDPALVKLDEDRKKREQIPLEIRQQLQTILRR